MQVGDRVRFIGPEYQYHGVVTIIPKTGYDIKIGEYGTLIERDGHKAQRVGKPGFELVTVEFDGHDRPTVLDINRIEKV